MIATAMTITGTAVYWAMLTGGESRWFAFGMGLLVAASVLLLSTGG